MGYIKNASIQYCKILRKVKNSKEMKIRKELEKETQRIEENKGEELGELGEELISYKNS